MALFALFLVPSFRASAQPANLMLMTQVDAKLPYWQASGVALEKNQTVSLDVVDGLWTHAVGSAPYNNGLGTNYICADFLPPHECTEPMPRERQGSLIGRVGSHLFYIGGSATVKVRQSGELYLWINDSALVEAFADNDGVLTVRIDNNSTETTAAYGARLDIGMPYGTNRGCPSPYSGCGGPFQGFYAGVSTDVVLDGYKTGVAFDIQDALAQDHLDNPGRYRYGTARHAEDMRRYFSHNQLLLPHTQPYQAGDVAFFDWNDDDITDHVSIVSKVSSSGRPLQAISATNIYFANPTGEATEREWTGYHDTHSQGHGRLNEATGPPAPAIISWQSLRITVNSQLVTLTLNDAAGNTTSEDYDENLVATNIDKYIPYIPGGSYRRQGMEQLISVTQPLANGTPHYQVRLTGTNTITYSMTIETVQDDMVTDSASFTRQIGAGEAQTAAISLNELDGIIGFDATAPMPAPMIQLPALLEMIVPSGMLGKVTLPLSESGGKYAVTGLELSLTGLLNQLGEKVPAQAFTISPASFSLAAGEDRDVSIQLDSAGLTPGLYQGSLLLQSENAGTYRVPFTLHIQFHKSFLPLLYSS